MARRTYYSLRVFKSLCIIHYTSSSIRTICLEIIRIPYCRTQTKYIHTAQKKKINKGAQTPKLMKCTDLLVSSPQLSSALQPGLSMAKLEQSLDMGPWILAKKAVVHKAMRLKFLYATQSPSII